MLRSLLIGVENRKLELSNEVGAAVSENGEANIPHADRELEIFLALSGFMTRGVDG